MTAHRDITVVIPSVKDAVRTAASVPEDVPIRIEREGTLNEARNRGVHKADTDCVIIMDDDIAFAPETIDVLAERVDSETVVGVADWDFGWIAGRVMAFERSTWAAVGGFDERLGSHMGDTEFALSVLDAGYRLTRVPRDWFDHEPHSRSITTWDRAWRLSYLSARYPTHAPHMARCMAGSAEPPQIVTVAKDLAPRPTSDAVADGGTDADRRNLQRTNA